MNTIMNTNESSDRADTNDITIVTGLPRSGTSMMMQMLAAGGLPALTDDHRKADEDNLKGYLEFKKAMSLRQDSSWITQAKGRAVKIIAQLLEHLPPENYRYLFMQRDMDEVVRSQRTMLERSKKRGAQLPEEQLKDIFVKQLIRVEKMLERDQSPVLKINYRDCVDDPAATARAVNQFLNVQLDEQAMAAAVDVKLYRQRNY